MHDTTRTAVAIGLVVALAVQFLALPAQVTAYTPGDEAAVFGHTFDEEYWTNDSIIVQTKYGNASFTASYVHVDTFSSFLVAFNRIVTNGSKEIMLPYQLFGMHYLTPGQEEVFIGAVFAFLMVHNETYGNNSLPDVGHEASWFVIPMSTGNPWPDVTPQVEAIPAEKLGDGHYRFGMRYIDMPARVVATNSTGGFIASLLLPILTVLVSEIRIEYDIRIDNATGEVRAETLYTIGQVERARLLGVGAVEPSDIINEQMEISAVHYLSVFTSKYTVANATSGQTLVPPTRTQPLNNNITVRVGDDSERALDVGLGREYSLYNESTDPWTLVSDNETALNSLLAAKKKDFVLIAWQAPLSAFILAHMAYGLSSTIRERYPTVQALVNNATNEFHSSQWWYAVTFPKWNGLRVQQDPSYVAHTDLAETTTTTTTTSSTTSSTTTTTSSTTTTTTTSTNGTTTPGAPSPVRTGPILVVAGIVGVIVIVVVVMKRRH